MQGNLHGGCGGEDAETYLVCKDRATRRVLILCSRRQMRLIQAVKEQVLKPDILLKVPAITDALRGNIRTSLTFDDAIALVNFFNGSAGQEATNNLQFVSELIGLDFLDATSNEAGFIYIPKAGKGNYSAIQSWLQSSLNSSTASK